MKIKSSKSLQVQRSKVICLPIVTTYKRHQLKRVNAEVKKEKKKRKCECRRNKKFTDNGLELYGDRKETDS